MRCCSLFLLGCAASQHLSVSTVNGDTVKIEPWGSNSLRVRVRLGGGTIDDSLPGASLYHSFLNPLPALPCPRVHVSSSICNPCLYPPFMCLSLPSVPFAPVPLSLSPPSVSSVPVPLASMYLLPCTFRAAPPIISKLFLPGALITDHISALGPLPVEVQENAVTNGNIKAEVGTDGMVTVTRISDGRIILTEILRQPSPDGAVVKFNSSASESIFGFGEHQQGKLNMKGSKFNMEQCLDYGHSK